jgi:Protein of unknown function (DUF3572)
LQCAPKPVIAGLDPAIYPPSRDCFANAPRFPEIAMADKPRSMGPQNQRAAAESLAIAALAFLAAEPGRLGRFLALTGIGPESIRAAAHQPQFPLARSFGWRRAAAPCICRGKLDPAERGHGSA